MGLEWKLNCWPFCLKEQSLNTVEVTHNDIFNMWMTSDRSLKQYYCCVSCYFCHFIVVHCDVMQTTQRSSLATILSTFPFTLAATLLPQITPDIHLHPLHLCALSSSPLSCTVCCFGYLLYKVIFSKLLFSISNFYRGHLACLTVSFIYFLFLYKSWKK